MSGVQQQARPLTKRQFMAKKWFDSKRMDAPEPPSPLEAYEEGFKKGLAEAASLSKMLLTEEVSTGFSVLVMAIGKVEVDANGERLHRD